MKQIFAAELTLLWSLAIFVQAFPEQWKENNQIESHDTYYFMFWTENYSFKKNSLHNKSGTWGPLSETIH